MSASPKLSRSHTTRSVRKVEKPNPLRTLDPAILTANLSPDAEERVEQLRQAPKIENFEQAAMPVKELEKDSTGSVSDLTASGDGVNVAGVSGFRYSQTLHLREKPVYLASADVGFLEESMHQLQSCFNAEQETPPGRMKLVTEEDVELFTPSLVDSSTHKAKAKQRYQYDKNFLFECSLSLICRIPPMEHEKLLQEYPQVVLPARRPKPQQMVGKTKAEVSFWEI